MPKLNLPGLKKKPKGKNEDQNPEGRTDRSVSFRAGSAASSKKSLATITTMAARDCDHTITSLMTVRKNPSTIFKPPFGTNTDEHHSRLGEHAQNLWKYNKITDLTVKLRGSEYPCHKTVLSCYSKYFKELLLDQKGTVNVVHLRLPSVTNTAFEVLLTYMYTSKLNLTCQNIGEVYTASRKLGIDGALILCKRILTGKAKYGVHSVYVYVTAKKQYLDDCAAKALKIMTKRFEQIVGTPEFLDLDFPQVLEYLNQDVLATRSEVIVFLAALKWLSVKYLEREQYAIDLLGCVRFQMMTLNEILACFSPPLLPGILEQKSIRDTLLAATCYVAAVTVNEEKRFERYSCRPRKYLLKREPILLWDPSIFDSDRHAIYVEEMAATTIQAAYRGYKARKSIEADQAAGIIQAASRRHSSKKSLADLDEFEPPKDDDDETYIQKIESRSDSGSKYSLMESIRKSVVNFIGGGVEDKDDTNSQVDQSMKSDRKEDSSTSQKERNLSRTSSTDTLIGHINNFAENTEIKKFTSDTVIDMSSEAFKQSFSHGPETVHKVYSKASTEEDVQNLDIAQHSTSTSEENQISSENLGGSILVTGGFRSDNEKDDSEGKMMFTYNSVKNKWKSYGTMEKARHHHCLVCLNEVLYFIGGCNPDKTKSGRMVAEKSCFKLDLESRKWSKISKMKHSRMYHGVVELGGKIYVVGGKDDKDRMLSSVEIYSPASNKWDELESPLKTPTMGVGLCVHQGKLWVIGGMIQDNEGNISLLNEVKCYDFEKKRWSYNLSQLPFPRAFSTAISYENCIYIIGGTSQEDQEEQLTSVSDVLYYDSNKKEWVLTTNLPFPRHFVETAVIGNELYVLGGLTSYEKTAVDEVIVYVTKSQKWSSCAPMPVPLCGFASTFIPQTAL